jgi:hypothetical protein
MQNPNWQLPLPLLHGDPSGSLAVQLVIISLHESLQSPSLSGPGHGAPPLTQAPLWHASAPVQNRPSSVQGVPSASVTAMQFSTPVPPPSHSGAALQPSPFGSAPQSVPALAAPLQSAAQHGVAESAVSHASLPEANPSPHSAG